MFLNESIQVSIDPNDGSERFYILNDDNTKSPVLEYSDTRYKTVFERLIEDKGRACLWAYQHHIGLNPVIQPKKDTNGNILRGSDGKAILESAQEAKEKARARYVGAESWYDTEHFLWIQLPNQIEPQLAQFRVSNHNLSHFQWEQSHFKKNVINCATCLNIVIDNHNRNSNTRPPATGPYTITSVEVDYDPNSQSQQQIQTVDAFVRAIQSGSQPTVTLNTISTLFGPNIYVARSDNNRWLTTQQSNVHPNQFKSRRNAPVAIDRHDPVNGLGYVDAEKLIDNSYSGWGTILEDEETHDILGIKIPKQVDTIPREQVISKMNVIPEDDMLNGGVQERVCEYTDIQTKEKATRRFNIFTYNGKEYALEEDEEIINDLASLNPKIAKYNCIYVAYETKGNKVFVDRITPIVSEQVIKSVGEQMTKQASVDPIDNLPKQQVNMARKQAHNNVVAYESRLQTLESNFNAQERRNNQIRRRNGLQTSSSNSPILAYPAFNNTQATNNAQTTSKQLTTSGRQINKPIVENKIRKHNILEDKNMRVFVKTRRGLEQLGEGMLYTKKQISLNEESIYGGSLRSKRQLRLREEFTNGKVSLTLNPNGQDVRASSVQTSAQNMLHQVPQATAVTVQADDIDGVTAPTFSPSDPRNDTVQQLTTKNATSSAVQNAAKNGGTIKITKDDPNQTAMEVKRTSKKIVEMRRNSIPFSKKELSKFLSNL